MTPANPLMPNDDELERLFIGLGLTAREIAEMHGLTRNQVAGRLDRLGLKKVILGIQYRRTPPSAKRRTGRTEAAIKPAIEPLHTGWWTPDRSCQWIDGDPCGERTLWCGRPVKPGTVYCAAHHEKAYQAVNEAA